MRRSKGMRIVLLLGVLAALSGCATVDGIGRDISGAANLVRDTF